MINNIKKMFKKEETTEGKIEREIREIYKKTEKKEKSQIARREKIMECRAVLDECYNYFQNTIIIENSRTNDLESKGYIDNDHRDRVREAAIGMLVAKQAIIKLKRITTDGELNSTINQLGMALRQIQRLDNSTNAISYSTRKELNKWYPYPLEENKADKEMREKLEVPADIRDRVDDEFITSLINGVSFDECVKRSVSKKKSSKTQNDYDMKMDMINKAFPDEDSLDLDEVMKNKYGNRI